MILVCEECGTEFMWDESPADDRCAVCAAIRAWAMVTEEDAA